MLTPNSHGQQPATEAPDLPAAKLGEEAVECVIEAMRGDDQALTREAADLIYHLLVVLAAGVSPSDVWTELKAAGPVRHCREDEPQLKEDSTTAYDPENIFAKILNGSIPCNEVDQTRQRCLLKILIRRHRHSLVIPKGAYTDLTDFAARASDAEIADWVRALFMLPPARASMARVTVLS